MLIYCFAFLAISSSTAVLSSAIVALGSLAPKTAVPATRTLEPERQIGHRAVKVLTGLGALAGVARSDTAVHLDILPREPVPQVDDLVQALGHELLSSLPRSDRHDQQQVRGVSELLRDDARRGLGGDGEAGFEVVRVDQIEHLLVVLWLSGDVGAANGVDSRAAS